MMRRTGLWGGLILACLSAPAPAASGGPPVVLYSRGDCPFCEALRRDDLKPLTANWPPPTVGARLPDFYQSHLDEAPERSVRALKKP